MTALPVLGTSGWILLVAATVLLLGAAWVVLHRRPLDPQRGFSLTQRRTAERLAGGRCEMEGFGWIRCRRAGAHADHWLPWARGGATSEGNLVWACARHNLAKSSRVPTAFATWRLARRRRRYFPAGIPVRPGQWYGKQLRDGGER